MKKIIVGLSIACMVVLPILFYGTETFFHATCVALVVPVCVCIGLVASQTGKKLAQMQQYHNITIGMSKKQVFGILGVKYTRCQLRNGREKYEWQIGGSRYKSYYYKVRRVTVYFDKNGLVEDVTTMNM